MELVGAAAGEGGAEGVMFTARSALTFLAESPNGSTEQLMRAHGYPAAHLPDLLAGQPAAPSAIGLKPLLQRNFPCPALDKLQPQIHELIKLTRGDAVAAPFTQVGGVCYLDAIPGRSSSKMIRSVSPSLPSPIR